MKLTEQEQAPVSAGSGPSAGIRLELLGWVFLRIGATAFGGLGAGLALIERDLVEKRKLLTQEDVLEALTYTKLLPGSTLIQVVSYLGFKLGGWPGSALATAAFILPSALMMLGLAALYGSVSASVSIAPALRGLSAAVVGLLLATTYRLGKANIRGISTLALAVAAFVAGGFFGVNAALIVVVSGLVGVLLFSRTTEGER